MKCRTVTLPATPGHCQDIGLMPVNESDIYMITGLGLHQSGISCTCSLTPLVLSRNRSFCTQMRVNTMYRTNPAPIHKKKKKNYKSSPHAPQPWIIKCKAVSSLSERMLFRNISCKGLKGLIISQGKWQQLHWWSNLEQGSPKSH